VGLALGIQAFIVKPYQIPSGSMMPTLEKGQRVLVNRLSHRLGGDPDIGDVVVFHPPLNAVPTEQDPPGQLNECAVSKPADEACPEAGTQMADTNFIKRVVAGPGDTLSIRDGHPVVNGVEAHEDFIKPCQGASACSLPKRITIPPDHYFMMGDNRGFSDDSRFWGPIPRDWIIGAAFATYWPPNRIGLL
jgi:signal peptidase I